jgi:hypothetical protein
VDRLLVLRDDGFHVALGTDEAVVQPDRLVAHPRDLLEGVRGQDHADPVRAQLVDAPRALLPEGQVAHRHDLVEDEQLRVQLGDDAEGQPERMPSL